MTGINSENDAYVAGYRRGVATTPPGGTFTPRKLQLNLVNDTGSNVPRGKRGSMRYKIFIHN